MRKTFTLSLVAAVALAGPGSAAERRAEAGKCLAEDVTLVRREAPDKPWQVVQKDEKLMSGDLLIGLPGAEVASKNNGVRLTFLTDLDGKSPFPVVESAVVLHETADLDLDFTLDRGRVVVANTKEKGAARVRVRVFNQSAELVLEEPGAKAGLELYGRWPKGVPFKKDGGPEHVPMFDLALLVLNGRATLKHGEHEFAMNAPPGPALIHWNNVTGRDPRPQKMEKLPDWVGPGGTTDAAKTRKENIEHFRSLLKKGKSMSEALNEMLRSDKEQFRRAAVVAMGALDDLTGMGNAMLDAKTFDVWDQGVLSFRHWLGRAPGQDLKAYNWLVEKRGATPVQAEITMQLLHSFGDEDLARPETYDVLIRYLESERLGIRGLAYWHLVRLVPQGEKLGYNPLDPKEKRAEAVKKWRQLIPAGKLPPKPDK